MLLEHAILWETISIFLSMASLEFKKGCVTQDETSNTRKIMEVILKIEQVARDIRARVKGGY